MITYMDRDIGRLLDQLRRLGLAENTLVLFASDNGPHMESHNDPLRFDPAGPLRGMKRELYEGGIRTPMIAWRPNTIQPGQVSDHVGYFGDLLATACELAGVAPPPDTNSISFLPALLGQEDRQQQHEFLYWEFYEQGSAQAVRWGDWKAVRQPMFSGRIELYDVPGIPERNTTWLADRMWSRRCGRSWTKLMSPIPTGGRPSEDRNQERETRLPGRPPFTRNKKNPTQSRR